MPYPVAAVRNKNRVASKIFTFDPALATLTPSMANRAGSIYPGAPIIQGKQDNSGVPDVLSYGRGDLVHTTFYANLDPNQGSIVVRWRPEILNKAHLWMGQNDQLRLFWREDINQLRFDINDYQVAANLSPTVSTLYVIVARWDCDYTLDGTNYLCLSINDAHTFGISTAPGVQVPGTTAWIGTDAGARDPAGLEEGFTVYRRPLHDGVYGWDAGHGDEIARISAGERCEEVTGGDDILFQFPTSGPGPLVSGNGEAYSWPTLDNVENHHLMEDGGYLGGPYGMIFNGSTTNIDHGSDATLDDIPAGGDVTWEGWFRHDSTGEGGLGGFLNKGYPGSGGYTFHIYLGANTLEVRMDFATIDINEGITVPSMTDGKWHHYAFVFDSATKIIDVYMDGIFIDSTSAGSGAYQSDASNNLIVGQATQTNYSMDGAVGWYRISDTKRYTADFVPLRTPPASDGNTVLLCYLDEGTGATVDNAQGDANRDGTITSGTWEAQWDGEGTPVVPYSVEFNATTTSIVVSDGAAIQDLHDGAFEVGAWVRADGKGEGIAGRILDKSDSALEGWVLTINDNVLQVSIRCATTNAVSSVTFGIDSKWHYVSFTFDDAGDRKVYIAIDGVFATVYNTQTAGVGAVVSDVGNDLYIGNRSDINWTFDGAIGHVSISNAINHTANFVPPDRLNPGAIANRVVQYDFRDGAGVTLDNVEGTAAYDGTISNGTWNTVEDMSTDAPGERIYNWGYTSGVDAVDEGFTQTLVGLSAGQNYVCIPVITYGKDRRAKPYIQIYDETNGAEIVKFALPWLTGTHDGGDNVAALSDSTAPRWWGCLVGGTVYNITDGSKGTITACGSSVTATLAGGTDNDWDDGDVYMIVPKSTTIFAEDFTFELPTVARHGVAANCTSISVKVLNDNDEGVFYVHQVQLLPNLVDNPGMEGTYEDESGGAGFLMVAPAWSNSGCEVDGTDILAAETTIVHSGSKSQKIATSSSSEGIRTDANSLQSGHWYLFSIWLYGDGAVDINIRDNSGSYFSETITNIPASWNKYSFVFYATGNNYLLIRQSSTGQTFYVDDVSLIIADDVSITADPADATESLENGGIRVDGRDGCSQPIPAGILKATKGKIRIKFRLRHGYLLYGAFYESFKPYVAVAYKDANNYIRLADSNNTRWKMTIVVGGVSTPGSGIIINLTEDTEYLLEIEYNSTQIIWAINGTIKDTITPGAGIDFGANIPDTFYAGSDASGANQIDAVFLAP